MKPSSRSTKPASTKSVALINVREPAANAEPCSPLPTLKRSPAITGTPYQSAQNCSNCRLDKLESATYWITQIKLAESVGKHSVSAAFFRLAHDCRAEPLRMLRMELRSYAQRHGPALACWSEVLRMYGLSNEKGDSTSAGNCLELCVDSVSLLNLTLEDEIERNVGEDTVITGELKASHWCEHVSGGSGNSEKDELGRELATGEKKLGNSIEGCHGIAGPEVRRGQ